MKSFFSWLLNRWVLSLLAVLVGALLIWFEGPLFSFNGNVLLASETTRWILILLLLAFWAGFWTWRVVAEKIASIKLMRVVAGDDGKAPPETAGGVEIGAEMQVLAARMQEAIAILRKMKKGAGASGHIMYQLPWYMFVGSPGAGKTTALSHSGLQFPLSGTMGSAAIGGVGGTRNCDWWFTDEAVLLDTAGRYTTQDSFAAVDNAAWNGFLDLLARLRKRRPVNGVIVAISAADLLQKNDSARKSLAISIRARIKELHERLGIRFPIYVMVTKCDLLAGFVEFFDTLTREERAQVWGMTFPLQEADRIDHVLELFPAEFQALEHQLQVRVLERMQMERDVQRRALLYGFPQQFAGIGDVLNQLLLEIFQSTRYEERALLRGVYFTSGTQEGNPIDRVIGSLASAFGLERQALPANVASGRSFFVTQLLRDVVFKEAGLAGTNLRLERERRILQWGALGLLGLLLSAVLAARVISFVGNRQLVKEVATRTTAIENIALSTPRAGSLVQLLPLLNAVRELPAGYAERDKSVPALMRLGLYQGVRLGPAEVDLYRRLLQDSLLPRLLGRIEDQLRRGAANNPDFLYEALRVYLMLGDRKHFDADALQAWFDFDFSANLPEADEGQRKELARHVAALLEFAAASAEAQFKPDAVLVTETRLTLAQLPTPQRVYDRMKKDFMRQPLAEFSVISAGGQGASLVLTRRSGAPLSRGVPGLYTLAGYRQFVDQSDQAIADVALDSWVIGQQEALASLSDIEQTKLAVKQIYYSDYIREWEAFLSDVTIVPFASLDDGARLSNILAGAESPLRKFMHAAATETTLDSARLGAQVADSLVKAVKGKLSAYKKKLEAALGSGDLAPAAEPNKEVNPVDAHFKYLHKMVAGGSGPAPIEQMLGLLKEAAIYFDDADRARRTGSPMPSAEVLAKIKREAQDKPAPLGDMLKNIDSIGGGITTGSDRARLNAAWGGGAGPFCRQAIAGRYPLVRGSANEVLTEDFGKFFAPGGLIDDFFQKNLQTYVDMSEGRWRWRSGGAAALGISDAVLADFQRAAVIRDMFFSAGSKQASMRFELKPVSADASLVGVLLDIDGQSMNYAPGAAASPALFQVPSGKRNGQVHIAVLPSGLHSDLKTEGPWAWLRMLDLGLLEPTAQSERYLLSFNLDGRKLVLDLTASSVVNAFRRDALEQFHCPDRL